MQVTRWHLLIGWSEVYSRGCTSTSPIFLPRHPSHILESEAASKDKHDKPREREREKLEILFFVQEAKNENALCSPTIYSAHPSGNNLQISGSSRQRYAHGLV